MASHNDIENSITEAGRFLESQCAGDGLWRDFHTLAGSSSDWVSGFVSYAVSHSEALRKNVLRALKALLFRQRLNGGWSYNKTVPTDCDSTAWALMALTAAPRWRPSAIKRAVKYIKYHQDKTLGGFSTYSVHDRIDQFIGASHQGLTRGWLGVHPCVTSVVIQGLLVHGEPIESEYIQAAAQYLLKERDAQGVWQSYWWKGYGYSTYHSLRALYMSRVLDTRELKKTSRFLLLQQQEDGGWNDSSGEESEVFATSFNLLSLLLFPDEEILKTAEKGTAWLLRHQNQDGSWPTTPILRIPPPMEKDPENIELWRLNQEGTGVIIEDSARIFTSAAAFWALSVFRSMTL